VIVHPIDNEIRKPWILSFTFKQTAEKFETVLSKVVTEDLKGHECLVLSEGLGEERKAEVVNIVVGHVDVDQTLVDGEGLGDGLRAVVGTLVVRDVERLKAAVLSLEVLRNRLASFEAYFVCIKVKHFQGVVFEQVLHQDVTAVVTQQVLANRELLEADVVLEHLAEMDGDGLADGLVHWVLNIKLLQSEVRAVEHREDADDSVVVDFVVSKVQRQQLVVGEQQLSHHHRPIRLYLV
jgi:hypothetical protein